MKKTLLYPAGMLFLAISIYLLVHPTQRPPAIPDATKSTKNLPSDWMYDQRAYPFNHIDRQAYQDALRQTKLARIEAQNRGAGEWVPAGPVNIGGRITDVALDPTDPNIIYAGTSAGGIFKSSDGGITWVAVFDDAGTLSIGDLAVAPSAPNIVYAGTGEANGSFDSGAFFGNGIYKSTDAGGTWENVGLENTNHTGRIVVDPQNADRVYAAATGVLYGKNEDRGLYRTLDGGQTWEKILYISDSTACIDVAINPQNANIVYAAMWERIRKPWGRRYGGSTSGIFRSLDGGENWEQLTNGLPISDTETGRTGLAVSPSNPNVVYACFSTNVITNVFDGIYKSTDAGTSWLQVDDGSIANVFSSFGWFFGNLRIAPNDPDKVWCLGVPLIKSENGGVNWSNVTANMHVDQHALEIHPMNPDFMVAGNDGGVYISQNGGGTWSHVEILPITMFYNAEIDFQAPERLFGGTQDNGTNRTLSGAVNGWEQILGGDGFHVLVDPTDPNYVYAEYQYGNLFRSDDGGNSMTFIFNGGNDDRTNWNTPIALDPSDPATIYFGANVLYRSTNRGGFWEAISPDLTDGQHPSGSLSFGTITTIAVAPSNPLTIYVGTDDGNVQVTNNGGDTWNNISAGLPDRFVSSLAVHPDDAATAYVALSGYRNVDYQPHLLQTTDGGETWIDISGNLPEIPINDVVPDPSYPSILYIANDLGVWQIGRA
ncbi:MAG: glycosyl hydrolase, partial [Saprospiraceae bacterium]